MNCPDLKGKTISITIMDDEINYDLANPHFEDQCGRVFIIGTIPSEATESGWTANKTGAVAWDRVTGYVLFDSSDDYEKAVKKSSDYDKNEVVKKQNKLI